MRLLNIVAILKGSDFQPLYRMTLQEVLGNDCVDVFPARIAVPDAFRIYHNRRALRATIKATGLIDAYLTRSGKSESLDSFLGIVTHGNGTFVGTTRFAAFALIDAEKHMISVVGLGHGLG
jgi:hypothetical protein